MMVETPSYPEMGWTQAWMAPLLTKVMCAASATGFSLVRSPPRQNRERQGPGLSSSGGTAWVTGSPLAFAVDSLELRVNSR